MYKELRSYAIYKTSAVVRYFAREGLLQQETIIKPLLHF